MVALNQLCHIHDLGCDTTYQVGVVTEIYDEYILIKMKSGDNYRLPVNNVSNNQVRFLHSNGVPALIKKGFWGYRFP